MALAPVPTPEVLWQRPPVLALAALRGAALGRLGEPSTSSPAASAAAGAAVRTLHDAPLPPWPVLDADQLASRLDAECARLVATACSPPTWLSQPSIAEAALRPWTPASCTATCRSSTCSSTVTRSPAC